MLVRFRRILLQLVQEVKGVVIDILFKDIAALSVFFSFFDGVAALSLFLCKEGIKFIKKSKGAIKCYIFYGDPFKVGLMGHLNLTRKDWLLLENSVLSFTNALISYRVELRIDGIDLFDPRVFFLSNTWTYVVHLIGTSRKLSLAYFSHTLTSFNNIFCNQIK